MDNHTLTVFKQLQLALQQFRRACDQIVLLGSRLHALNYRYMDAKSNRNQIFQRTLRLRIMTVQGLTRTFTHYATLKKEQVLSLRRKIQHLNYDAYLSDESDDYSTDEDSSSEEEI